MDAIEIRSYAEPNGRVPFQIWLESCDRLAQSKITVALTNLKRDEIHRALDS